MGKMKLGEEMELHASSMAHSYLPSTRIDRFPYQIRVTLFLHLGLKLKTYMPMYIHSV